MNKEQIRLSRFLSKILRHSPDEFGISLDKEGWAKSSDIIKVIKSQYDFFNQEYLVKIVNEDDKQRYALKGHDQYVRANQGHSTNIVDLELTKVNKPVVLYHGTFQNALDLILEEGLKSMSRQYVHLHPDKNVATTVGNRHGKAVLLEIDTQSFLEEGNELFISDNNVYLAKFIPAKFLKTIG